MVKKIPLTEEAVEPSRHDQDWVGLIARIADGDQQAMSLLYNGTNRLIFGLILRILGDRSMAEEVLLDVYAQVWRQANRYDIARGAALGWITTIARSRAIDRLRSERHNLQQDELNEATTSEPARLANPETATVLSEISGIVRAALDGLPPEQREVIELSYYSGYTQTEIAAKLGQPLGTIKTRTRLGMIKLREVLRPIMESPL
ncbi:MAG: sigma-70 family RNA polymerase sigma factor [Acidobacteria bacterium]|nr:sigma-70 family RNA polymerase sigma factor [Acidobacteriota bacterium]